MEYCIKNVVANRFVDFERKLGTIFEEKELKSGMLYNNKCDAEDDVEILNQIDITMPYKVVEVEE